MLTPFLQILKTTFTNQRKQHVKNEENPYMRISDPRHLGNIDVGRFFDSFFLHVGRCRGRFFKNLQIQNSQIA